MKVVPTLTSIASVMMLGLALSACSSKSAPTFTVGGTVVNLAGTGGGGLVLQDNLQDNLTVNANGASLLQTRSQAAARIASPFLRSLPIRRRLAV